MEYEQAVRNSPDIPFDASKKPIQGVLKPTSVPSPLNPFYKLNKIKLWVNRYTFKPDVQNLLLKDWLFWHGGRTFAINNYIVYNV